MKSLFGWFMAVLFLVQSPAVFADEKDDKLEAILREIKSLNQRVSDLEQKVRNLTSTKPAAKVQANVSALPMIPASELERNLHRYPDVKGVIRMQGESPGSLINGLHERERILRRRQFPAEVFFPRPILTVPNR